MRLHIRLANSWKVRLFQITDSRARVALQKKSTLFCEQ
jgi:hypothetical protein